MQIFLLKNWLTQTWTVCYQVYQVGNKVCVTSERHDHGDRLFSAACFLTRAKQNGVKFNEVFCHTTIQNSAFYSRFVKMVDMNGLGKALSECAALA